MDILTIIGLILAFINPVLGGVLIGFIVWLSDATTGIQLIVLSLTMMSIYSIVFIIWAVKKIQKLEKRLITLEEKTNNC
ncbi:MAG: hypothetical protein PHR56_03265 [Dehalococcoidales bacterium]|nr:hypothetical protein [Dehalococcoidales bacterium]